MYSKATVPPESPLIWFAGFWNHALHLLAQVQARNEARLRSASPERSPLRRASRDHIEDVATPEYQMGKPRTPRSMVRAQA